MSGSWRDAVPELPARFAVVLVRPAIKSVRTLHKRLRAGGDEALVLYKGQRGALDVVVQRTGERLGSLPPEDTKLLRELGAELQDWRPRVLEIKFTLRRRLEHIIVDLVHEPSQQQPAPVTLHNILDAATREIPGAKPPLS